MRHALRVVVVPSLLATAVVLAQAPAPAAPKPPGMDEMQVVFLKDAKWTAAKPPITAGIMVALIAADPAPGGSLAYVKFPAGVALAEHWHSAAEYTLVLSGHQRLTVEGKSSDLGPGDYIVIPAKTKHSAQCLPGSECILVTRRAGPTDYNWVK